jgi:hypothetical protein
MSKDPIPMTYPIAARLLKHNAQTLPKEQTKPVPNLRKQIKRSKSPFFVARQIVSFSCKNADVVRIKKIKG